MSRVIGYPKFRAQYLDPNGFLKPGAGYKLYTYQSGTVIPQVTYSDSALTAQNTNPIILDAAGECWLFPSLTGIYTFTLHTDTDVPVWSEDGIGADASATGYGTLRLNLADPYDVANGDAMIGVKQPFTGSTPTTQHAKNALSVDVFDFLTTAEQADVTAGTLLLDVTAGVQAALNASKVVRFQPGSYRAKGLTYSNGQSLIGPGRYLCTIKDTGGTSLLSKGAGTVNGLTVSGITFDHTSSSESGSICIDVNAADDVKIAGCAFKNCETAVKLTDAVRARLSEIVISDCVTGVSMLKGSFSGCRFPVVEDFDISTVTTGIALTGALFAAVSRGRISTATTGMTFGAVGDTSQCSIDSVDFDTCTATATRTSTSTAPQYWSNIRLTGGSPAPTASLTNAVWLDPTYGFINLRGNTVFVGSGGTAVDSTFGAKMQFTSPSMSVLQGGGSSLIPIKCSSYIIGANNVNISAGVASPEGAVTADPGSLYLRSNGDLWRKVTGTGNTGWVTP